MQIPDIRLRMPRAFAHPTVERTPERDSLIDACPNGSEPAPHALRRVRSRRPGSLNRLVALSEACPPFGRRDGGGTTESDPTPEP